MRSTGAAMTTNSAASLLSGVSHVALHQGCSARASLVSGRLAQITTLRAAPRARAARATEAPRSRAQGL